MKIVITLDVFRQISEEMFIGTGLSDTNNHGVSFIIRVGITL